MILDSSDGSGRFALDKVAGGFSLPVDVVVERTKPETWLVVEQEGRIRRCCRFRPLEQMHPENS